MEFKKNVLVQKEHSNSEYYTLIEKKDLEKVVSGINDGNTYIIDSDKEIKKEEIKKLNKIIKERMKEDEDFEPDLDFLIETFKLEVKEAGEAEPVEDKQVLFWHYNENKFILDNILDYEHSWMFEHWDGSNYKFIWLEEPDTTLSYNDDDIKWYNLDSFDGNNYCFKKSHYHVRVGLYNNEYYLREYSNYQGSFETIDRLSWHELQSWAEENQVELPNEMHLEESINQLMNGNKETLQKRIVLKIQSLIEEIEKTEKNKDKQDAVNIFNREIKPLYISIRQIYPENLNEGDFPDFDEINKKYEKLCLLITAIIFK